MTARPSKAPARGGRARQPRPPRRPTVFWTVFGLVAALAAASVAFVRLMA